MKSILIFVFGIILLCQPTFAMESTVFLENQGKLFLIIHALFAILLLGSMTHHVLIATRYFWGNFKKIRLEKLYVKVAFVSYVITFALGSIIYPSYRYHVRDQYFDIHAPWASNLFDIKEHWSAIGLAIFIIFFLMSLKIEPKKDKAYLFTYVFFSIVLAIIVWFSLISGLILTSVKAV